MHAARAVHAQLCGMRADDPACAKREEGAAVVRHAGADGGRRVIARARDDGRALAQTGLLCRAARDAPGDFGRFVNRGQNRVVQPERRGNLARPAAMRRIQQLHAGCVAHICGVFAGETEPDIILGQHDMAAGSENLGLVVFNPEKLGQAEAGQRGIAGDGKKLFRAQARVDLFAFRRAALIAPENGGA